MKSYGTPDAWLDLIASLVPDILQLVWSTWQTMPSLASDALEDPTTEEFCRRLRDNRTASDLPFRVDVQMVELGASAGAEQGRMDIVFSPLVPGEQVYFCLECKRLNALKEGTKRGLATEYVVHGMMRFMTGQYGSEVQEGGMVGYVLDGDVADGMRRVAVAVGARWQELGMKKPGTLLQSSVLSTVKSVQESHHVRGKTRDRFVIHHLFCSGA